ncbi:TPA: hypothetical protein DEO28_02555 [Candidatus Dependentiae bacterium]|nr:hypothetical protein [Candidatus Dependentiae bacterium]HBZ73369.1 hypothetical protein [Candidatus Dependentiae bacterium]
MKKFKLKIHTSLLIITTLFIDSFLNAGTIVYDLAGRVLDLTPTQSIYIPEGDSYTIKNGQVNNIRANNIIMHHSTSQLILENAKLYLSSDYTMTQGSMIVKGNSLIGSNNNKFTTQGHYILIDDGATFKFNNTTFVMQPPQKNIKLVTFSNSLSSLYLLNSTLKVDYINYNSTTSSDNGPLFVGGKLIIDGNCTIDNASTNTMNALQLGVSLSAEDCVLQIKNNSKLNINNAGLIINNGDPNSLNISTEATINVNANANFEIINSLDLNNYFLNLDLTSTNFFNGKTLSLFNGKISSKQYFSEYSYALDNALTSSNEYYALVKYASADHPDGNPNTVRIYNKNMDYITSGTYGDGYVTSIGADWSPDGKYLAVSGENAGSPKKNVRIYTFNGTLLSELCSVSTVTDATSTSPESNYNIRWSPDGRYIATESGDHQWLRFYSFDGAELNLITSFENDAWNTTNPAYYNTLDWTPNGKYLAWANGFETPGVYPLKILYFDGTTATQRTSTYDSVGAKCYSAQWSSTGKYLIRARLDYSQGLIYYFDGESLSLVTTFTEQYERYDWSFKTNYIFASYGATLNIFRFNGETLTPISYDNLDGTEGLAHFKISHDDTFLVTGFSIYGRYKALLSSTDIASKLSLQNATLNLNSNNTTLYNKILKSL